MKLIARIPQGRGNPERVFEGSYVRVNHPVSLFHTDFGALFRSVIRSAHVENGEVPIIACVPDNQFLALTLRLKDGHTRATSLDGWTQRSDGKWTSLDNLPFGRLVPFSSQTKRG